MLNSNKIIKIINIFFTNIYNFEKLIKFVQQKKLNRFSPENLIFIIRKRIKNLTLASQTQFFLSC